MRAASAALLAYLAAQRAAKDAPLLMADCYTFILRTGTILTYTNADLPIALNGFTYLANAVLVDGLQFKCTIGLDVDEQHVTIAARPTDTIGGVPFLVALHHGVFDGCEVQRERAFLTSWGTAPVGSVILFKGRVTSVDEIGRTSAQITVASDLVLLDIDMPRNLYQPTCVHTLYDSGCTLVKGAFGTAGIVGAAPSLASIPWSGASALYAQGTILFTSGINAGVSANVKTAASGALTLSYPLYATPAAGDTFTVYQGCDHTQATCKAKFNNLGNFRGFPYVPPPSSGLLIAFHPESQSMTCHKRARVVASARAWIGTPYHPCADIPGAGVDCGMLLVRVFVDAALCPPFDPRPYAADWHLHRGEERYLGFVLDHCREVAEAEPGDVLVFRYGRCWAHGGIVTQASPLTLVHAFSLAGCVLEEAVATNSVLADPRRAPRIFRPLAFESDLP